MSILELWYKIDKIVISSILLCGLCYWWNGEKVKRDSVSSCKIFVVSSSKKLGLKLIYKDKVLTLYVDENFYNVCSHFYL